MFKPDQEPRISLLPGVSFFLSIIVILNFSSCATQEIAHITQYSQASNSPLDREMVADSQPVSDPEDLKQLIKSLPLWELPAEEVDGWIKRNGKLLGDSLLIAGDGAQSELKLSKLAPAGEYELIVGSLDWPEGGYFVYKLKRLESGWQVIAR